MTRLLGLDVGDRRIGMAVGDDLSHTAKALGVIGRGDVEQDAVRLLRICQEQAIDALVVGLPLDADGTTGLQARTTQQWGAEMEARVALPVIWRDERFTTEEAENRLGRVPRTRGGTATSTARRRHRVDIDREAARLILQAELDQRAGFRS